MSRVVRGRETGAGGALTRAFASSLQLPSGLHLLDHSSTQLSDIAQPQSYCWTRVPHEQRAPPRVLSLMQSYRPPRSAATAAEVAVNPPNLEELIQEASEVTQALSDRKQKAIVERWLSDLRPLVVRPRLAPMMADRAPIQTEPATTCNPTAWPRDLSASDGHRHHLCQGVSFASGGQPGCRVSS